MRRPMSLPKTEFALLCRVRTRLCAFPVQHVIETMRPLPIEALGELPDDGFSTAMAASRRPIVLSADGAEPLDQLPGVRAAILCPVIVDNILMYRDNQHMTPQWSRFLAPLLADALKPIMQSGHPKPMAARLHQAPV